MEEVKSLFASKTFWGALVALVGGIGAIFGYTIAPADQTALITDLSGVASAIGSVIAIYGRAVASKKIG